MGIAGVVLSYLGNPPNTGFCVSCFMENIAGSIGLHGNIRMQYLRPEIIGFVIGSFLMAVCEKGVQGYRAEALRCSDISWACS